MIRCLLHLCYQSLHALDCGAVSGDGNCARGGGLVRQGVEGFDSGGAGGCFAGGDVDFGAAGLEEAVEYQSEMLRIIGGKGKCTQMQREDLSRENRLL